ncbi:MAG: hypothetical protein ABSC19_17240 [Syntrophorhabdales bacterium]
MNPTFGLWLVVAIFSATYLGLALGKVPWLRMDRAGIALVGATLMIVTGILPLPEAVRSVDYLLPFVLKQEGGQLQKLGNG